MNNETLGHQQGGGIQTDPEASGGEGAGHPREQGIQHGFSFTQEGDNKHGGQMIHIGYF